MTYTRRTILRKVSAVSALALASGTAAAADCSDTSQWQSETAYGGGDQVVYDDALWTAQWWTQGNEPAESDAVWEWIGACNGNGGGGDNQAPTASFTVSPVSPAPEESVTFDASSSADGDGSITSYEWDVGEGTTASGETTSHTYATDGEYTVTLTVTDDTGATDTDTTTVAVQTDGGGGGATDNRVVAYWMQWAQYDREYVPADIPFEDITHLQYAFMRPEQDGSISGVGDGYGQRYLFPESWHDVTTIADLNEQHPDVTFLISIGGWNDSEYFSDAAFTESSRQTFADECVRIVREGGVDGVDIDWEYPGGGGHPNNTVRDGDQERFTLLLQAVRDALNGAGQEDGTEYHLSTAMSADPETASGLEHGTLSSLLDFTSIMTFDYRGGFSDSTGHQSPLYENPDDPASNAAEWNVSSALEWYVDQGWDPGQLNMAVPFYGRSFADIQAPDGEFGTGVDDGLYQEFTGTGSGSFPPDTQESGIYDYWDIATSGGERSRGQIDLSQPGWETTYDDTAVSAWSYNQDESLMVSHETPQTVEEKMTWLSNSNYGGTMLWALSHDTIDHTLLGTLSNTLL